MIKRFHGIDRHKMSSTVSILNREGIEEKLVTIKGNLKNYIKESGPYDAVAIETGIDYKITAQRASLYGMGIVSDYCKYLIIRIQLRKQI